MKYIDLFEQFIPKLNNEPVEVSSIGSFGQRITNKGTKKIRKQDFIIATDDTIRQIVIDEINRLGKDADLNHIDVSQVTNMDILFEYTDFQGDVSGWDVSSVTTMNSMFFGCKKFNCDLSKWDVSKVNDMRHMFCYCEKFNSDLSKWKVNEVEDCFMMFFCCSNFNQNISNWDVSKVESMTDMFVGCPIKEEYKPKFNI